MIPSDSLCIAFLPTPAGPAGDRAASYTRPLRNGTTRLVGPENAARAEEPRAQGDGLEAIENTGASVGVDAARGHESSVATGIWFFTTPKTVCPSFDGAHITSRMPGVGAADGHARPP